MSVVDTDLRDLIAVVLEENRRKSPRVQANVVLQLLRPVKSSETPAPKVDPPRWTKWAERNAQWLRDGIAVTRNRTTAAVTALGLDPAEVRAVVIEPDVMHVFRWTDARERLGVGMPIVPDDPLEETG